MNARLEGDARVAALAELQAAGWSLVEGRDAVRRDFKFASFADAWGWMSRVAVIAEKLDHHPEWFNVYNRVEVVLTTHSVKGLSDLDLRLARAMDG
ncbi:MAG: 4a-hydroxytetrahydrobiopterin dehydratase [Silicimonas sp.]|nr:4a-hydroxytetrahydrobiopterin dehydratase [Silicimonas sp.]